VPVDQRAPAPPPSPSFSTDRTGGRCLPSTRRCADPHAVAATYLTSTDEKGRAARPGGAFHLGNGAIVERLNWLGDTSANGLKQASA